MNLKQKLFDLSKSSLGELLVGLVFEKFSSLLPVDRVKETGNIIAFWHPKPSYQKHIVIVPKKAIKSISDLSSEDGRYISQAYLAVRDIVDELGWDKQGYSVTVNGGSRQEVGQIHFHLYSGQPLS